MIFIERSPLIVPKQLASRAAAGRWRLEQEMAEGLYGRRPSFDVSITKRFRPLLEALFRGKCAYCESALGAISSGDIDYFRPRRDARQLDGHIDGHFYHWLSYEWTNLYLSCPLCNRNKGSSFPVYGQRAFIGEPLELEKRLLIDPCIDHPEQYLIFLEDGHVGPRVLSTDTVALYGGLHPGAVTIDVLGLNREALVEERRQFALRYRAFEKSILQSGVGAPDILRMVDGASPYSALARDLLAENTQSAATVRDYLRADLALELRLEINERVHLPQHMGSATPRLNEIRSTSITRIEINNFRAVEHFDCWMSEEEEHWKVLLGENATGKTSILRAIAIALMGLDFAKKNFAEAPFLRRKSGESINQGFIRVHLSTDPVPIEVQFDAAEVRFVHAPEGARTFVRAYGAIRIAQRRTAALLPPAALNVENLFDPHHELRDGDRWLREATGEELETALLALHDLLLLPPDVGIDAAGDKVEIPLFDDVHSIEELSSGYADVFNIFADIVAGFPEPLRDMNDAFGIVMIDELGAHLHPRWKMQIVSAFKTCFPRIQFIASTHEPLCLRELDADEIIVMRREPGGVRATDEALPSPKYMRVDQLLTSRFFGLQSTIDPRLDEDFEEYYELLRISDRSQDEEKRRIELRGKLAQVSSLGFTRRDQLLYELVDEFLARETGTGAGAIVIDEDLKRRVQSAWLQATALADELP